jgi:CheY-like chemotaxis protein
MDLDQPQQSWLQELESAFQPYPAFVNHVAQNLIELNISFAAEVVEFQELILTLEAKLASAVSANEALNKVIEQDASNENSSLQISSLIQELESAKQNLIDREAKIEALNRTLEHNENRIAETTQADTTELLSLRSALESAKQKIREQEYNFSAIESKLAATETKLAITESKLTEALIAEQAVSEFEPATRLTRQNSPESRAALAKTASLPERHVLLVDAAEINRVLMSHYFKGLPVKLAFATSVESALKKCESVKFDLILLDDEEMDVQQLKSTDFNTLAIQSLIGSKDERLEKMKSLLWSS